MIGPEHYREAERLLLLANGEYLDDSDDAAPRAQYADDSAWERAIEIAQELHEQKIRTAMLFASMANAHAALSVAAATALTGAMAATHYTDEPELRAWHQVGGTPKDDEVSDAP